MRFLAFLLCASAHSATLPASLFDQLQWRNIGPFRGGRVAAVSGVAGDSTTFYFGSVGGGVWKTTNAGTTWRPIFDQQPIASIGAIAVAPSEPERDLRGNGRGRHPLADRVRRRRVQIDRRGEDVDATWACATRGRSRASGWIREIPTWSTWPRSGTCTDRIRIAAFSALPMAGATWTKVLDRGHGDRARSTWRSTPRIRGRFTRRCGTRGAPVWSTYAPLEGPGSGLFKTTDGGDHWTQLAGHGLPESQWGRSGVAVAPGGKARLRADRCAGRAAGLYRSEDAGANLDARLRRCAHHQPQLVFLRHHGRSRRTPTWCTCRMSRSTAPIDGGRNFTAFKGAPGGDDYRILWIDPTDTRRMMLGSRPGHQRQPGWRPDVELLVQPADRADLSRDHRQPVPVSRLRRAAG